MNTPPSISRPLVLVSRWLSPQGPLILLAASCESLGAYPSDERQYGDSIGYYSSHRRAQRKGGGTPEPYDDAWRPSIIPEGRSYRTRMLTSLPERSEPQASREPEESASCWPGSAREQPESPQSQRAYSRQWGSPGQQR